MAAKAKTENGAARLSNVLGGGDAVADAPIQKAAAITAPKILVAAFLIRGTAPYVQNRFGQKAMEMMRTAQEAGPAGKKGKKRDPKDFKACWEQARHRSPEGWDGIPAPAFRNAMIDACRLVGFKMTHAKLGVFVRADGYDFVDGTPLVRLTGAAGGKEQPEYVEHAVRNDSGVADIRPRPLWAPGWTATVRVEFDGDMFSLEDVANLLARVGRQVGLGEGRPNSKNSAGLGWGLFEVLPGEVRVEDLSAA